MAHGIARGEWKLTKKLRFIKRDGVSVLQQQHKRKSIISGVGGFESKETEREWRDVEMVGENIN